MEQSETPAETPETTTSSPQQTPGPLALIQSPPPAETPPQAPETPPQAPETPEKARRPHRRTRPANPGSSDSSTPNDAAAEKRRSHHRKPATDPKLVAAAAAADELRVITEHREDLEGVFGLWAVSARTRGRLVTATVLEKRAAGGVDGLIALAESNAWVRRGLVRLIQLLTQADFLGFAVGVVVATQVDADRVPLDSRLVAFTIADCIPEEVIEQARAQYEEDQARAAAQDSQLVGAVGDTGGTA